MGAVGTKRSRPDGRIYLDFGRSAKGKLRRLWSLHGVGFTDELADRVLERIRARVTFDDLTLDEALAPFLANSPERLIRNRYERWLEIKGQEVDGGDRSPTYLTTLVHYGKPDGVLSWWDGQTIDQVDYRSLEDWSLWMAQRGLASKSRRNVLGVFRSFLTWLYRRHEVRELPRQWPWPKVPEHSPVVLAEETQLAVLAAIPDEKRGIYLAMGLLGLRPGEARALDVADVSTDGWLTVSKAVKGPGHRAPIRGTKSGRWKRLPMPELLAEWIERHVDPAARLEGRALFVHPRTGKRWAPTAMRREWAEACDRAEVPRCKLYEGTKHTLGTRLLGSGVSLEVIASILGHADTRSTKRYARMQDHAVVAALRPRSRGGKS